jgi:MFS family permease
MDTEATKGASADDSLAYPSSTRAWGLVVVLTIAYAISFVDRQIISLMVEPIKDHLDLSDTQIGLLMGPAFAVFYTIMGIPLGRAADKLSRRNLIVIGMSLWCLMTAASGLARNFMQLFLARMGIGIGEAALSPAALSMISDSFPPEKRTSPIGFYNSAIYIGSGMALILGGIVIHLVSTSPPVVVPLVGELVPWQTTFLIVGLPGLVIAAMIGFMREPTRKDVIKSKDGDVAEISMRDVLAYVWKRRGVYGSIFIGMAVVAGANFMFQGWVPTLYMRVHGWDQSSIAYSFGLIMLIFGPLGIFLGGRLGDYFSKKGDSGGHAKAAFIGSLFMMPGMIVTPVFPNPQVALVSLTLIPFGMAFITVNIVSSMLRVTPNQMRGLVYALLLLAMTFTGMSLGPFLPALITDYVFGNEMMLGYSMLIVSLSTAFVSNIAFYKCIGAFRSAKS